MIKYLLIQKDRLPKVEEISEEMFDICIWNKYNKLYNGDAIACGISDDVALLGKDITRVDDKEDNRLSYCDAERSGVNDVIVGDFIIIGYKNRQFVSLTDKQIAEWSECYGQKSIDAVMG